MTVNAPKPDAYELPRPESIPTSSDDDDYALLEEDMDNPTKARVDAYGEKIGGSAGEVTDSINLVKSIIGSGILTTPWAFALASTVPSFIALLLVFCVSTYSFLMVCKAGQVTGKQVFAEIWEACYGPKWAAFPDVVIVFLNYSTCVGYIILVGDFFPEVFGSFAPKCPLADRTNAILIVTFLVLLPLAWLKDLTSLRYTSIIGVGGILYTLVAVAIRSIQHADEGRPIPDDAVPEREWQWFSMRVSFFTAVSVLIYAFDAHANGAIMYSEHEVAGRDFASWRRVVTGAMFMVLVLTGSFGFFAYYAYGEATEENVLSTFPLDDELIRIARIAMAFSVVFAYPFWFNSMRRSLDGMVYRAAPKAWSEWYLMLPHRRPVQTVVMIGATMGLAIAVTDIGKFVALMGSALSVFEMYIIPAFLYLGAMKLETLQEKLPAYIIIALGVVFGVLGFTITLIEWIEDP